MEKKPFFNSSKKSFLYPWIIRKESFGGTGFQPVLTQAQPRGYFF